MRIIIYGKKHCGKCEAAKDKLNKMGFLYEVRDLEYFITLHEGWRTDGSVELLAASSSLDGAIPILNVEGDLLDYPSAMKKLKDIKRSQPVIEELKAEAIPA